MLHGDLTSADSAYRPLRPERIAETNVQYLALGHIHARSEVRRAGRTLYAYSGCLQGLGFDETGEKAPISARSARTASPSPLSSSAGP